MTKKKQEITAAELMARLQQDPTHRRSEAERVEREDRQREEVLAALRPVLRELREVGVTVDSLDDLPARQAPLETRTVSVLLRWVPDLSNEQAVEQVVRALAAARPGFAGRELAEAFDRTPNESLKWAIANTIASARPSGISEWLRERTLDRSAGKAREMLVIAAARLLPRDTAIDLLRKIADNLPGHVSMALAEVGREEELAVLEALGNRATGWQAREVEKAKAAIRRRMSR